MELFERIRYLCEVKEISQTKLGKKLGLSQSAFNRWLKKDTEHNLWDHLPKILELFPDVREEWLYIGREPAFKDGTVAEKTPTKEELDALKAENERLNAELNEERALNRKLTNKFLFGDNSKEYAPDCGKAAG